jgi:hypothetical protein
MVFLTKVASGLPAAQVSDAASTVNVTAVAKIDGNLILVAIEEFRHQLSCCVSFSHF